MTLEAAKATPDPMTLEQAKAKLEHLVKKYREDKKKLASQPKELSELSRQHHLRLYDLVEEVENKEKRAWSHSMTEARLTVMAYGSNYDEACEHYGRESVEAKAEKANLDKRLNLYADLNYHYENPLQHHFSDLAQNYWNRFLEKVEGTEAWAEIEVNEIDCSDFHKYPGVAEAWHEYEVATDEYCGTVESSGILDEVSEHVEKNVLLMRRRLTRWGYKNPDKITYWLIDGPLLEI